MLFLVPIGILFSTVRDLLHAWFVRQGDLRIPSTARIAQALGRTAVSLGGSMARLGAGGGLVFGQIAGTIGSVGVMAGGLRGQILNAVGVRRTAVDCCKAAYSRKLRFP